MSEESGIDTSVAGPSHAANRSSDAETDSSSDGSFICYSAKKVKRQQAFRKVWLHDPQFQPWLQETEDPCQGKCIVCMIFLTADKYILRNHATTTRHITNMQEQARALSSSHSDSTNATIDINVAGPSSAASICPDAETGSSNEHIFTLPGKSNVRLQSFREGWLEEPQFKLWLQRVEDNTYKARCKFCKKSITANRTNVTNHANSSAHIMNMRHSKGPATSTGEKTFAEQVKLAEMRVCMDAVEHIRPFQSYCHFIEMLQKALSNPDVFPHMTLNQKKM